MPAAGCLRGCVRIADIVRIVDTTVAALTGALRAIVEIATSSAAVTERTIAVARWALAVALWALSVTSRRTRCDNAEG